MTRLTALTLFLPLFINFIREGHIEIYGPGWIVHWRNVIVGNRNITWFFLFFHWNYHLLISYVIILPVYSPLSHPLFAIPNGAVSLVTHDSLKDSQVIDYHARQWYYILILLN